MSERGITLADELFRDVNVRLRIPEERLYRMVDMVLDDWMDAHPADDDGLSIHRLTWDWYDRSVEIYLDAREAPADLDLRRLWEAGFSIVWVHPFRCTKDGHRDHAHCRCPGRRAPSEKKEGKP